MEDCYRIGKSSNDSEKTIIRFTNRKYCKQDLLNWKSLETLNYSEDQFGGGTKVLINQKLAIRNEQLSFNFRQLKMRIQKFVTFSKNVIVYIKRNKNSSYATNATY